MPRPLITENIDDTLDKENDIQPFDLSHIPKVSETGTIIPDWYGEFSGLKPDLVNGIRIPNKSNRSDDHPKGGSNRRSKTIIHWLSSNRPKKNSSLHLVFEIEPASMDQDHINIFRLLYNDSFISSIDEKSPPFTDELGVLTKEGHKYMRDISNSHGGILGLSPLGHFALTKKEVLATAEEWTNTFPFSISKVMDKFIPINRQTTQLDFSEALSSWLKAVRKDGLPTHVNIEDIQNVKYKDCLFVPLTKGIKYTKKPSNDDLKLHWCKLPFKIGQHCQ